MNGLGHSNLNSKPTATVGTLESLVNQQATSVATASETMTMNVTIPCTATRTGDLHRLAVWGLGDSVAHGTGVCRCYSTHVGSCIAIVDGNWLLNLAEDEQRQEGCRKRTRWGGGEWGNHQGTATYNHPVTTQNTFVHEREPENTTSLGSPENMSIGKAGGEGRVTAAATTEEHVSAYCQPKREAEEKRRLGKSSLSTRRRRAAATHNQSERKRRDKINQRMMTLQKMVPNSSKTDKVSVVLDEVIDYVRQLQAQVQMISRTNVLMPLTMQQQIQLSMMAPMVLGLGLGGMPGGVMSGLSDNHPNIPRVPPPPVVLHPFMPVASVPATTVMQDPLPTLLASQSSPAMTWDAYSRLAAMYYQQHMLQQQHSNLNPNN